jgi:hypothetical protein
VDDLSHRAPGDPQIAWVVLTQGNRPAQLGAAIESLTGSAHGAPTSVLVIANGAGEIPVAQPGVVVVSSPLDLGVPGGRDLGVRSSATPVIGFLDDDAIAPDGASERIVTVFDEEPDVGAVALRIVDEYGHTARRHVPRLGAAGVESGGDVALVLGGACAVRRSAYESVGGYFTALRYGHEEVELCWRLVDAGWRIRYLPDVEVYHPRTEIGRHDSGWFLTGRNRVWIARRTLPAPLAVVHVIVWLVLGTVRAPSRNSRSAYLRGWAHGWRDRVVRRPISWHGAWRLTRLGRPPVF